MKKVICIKTITNPDVIIEMQKWGIEPPVIGERYNVIEEFTDCDGARMYILKEYHAGDCHEHGFEACMFEDVDWEAALNKEIIQALKAPAPKGKRPCNTWPEHALDAMQYLAGLKTRTLDVQKDLEYHSWWEQRLKDGFVMPSHKKPELRQHLCTLYAQINKAKNKEEYDAGIRMINLLKRLLAT